jgi:hypothetical protein
LFRGEAHWTQGYSAATVERSLLPFHRRPDAELSGFARGRWVLIGRNTDCNGRVISVLDA